MKRRPTVPLMLNSYEKKSEGKVVPFMVPMHCRSISSLHCERLTLLQMAERLGWPLCHLLKALVEFPQAK